MQRHSRSVASALAPPGSLLRPRFDHAILPFDEHGTGGNQGDADRVLLRSCVAFPMGHARSHPEAIALAVSGQNHTSQSTTIYRKVERFRWESGLTRISAS
jgi:hypothetical protein